MCLFKVTKTFSPPEKKERKAWKILFVDPTTKKLYAPFKWIQLEPNKWLSRRSRCTISASIYHYARYEVGFHVYKTKKEADEALRIFMNNRYNRIHWKVFEVVVKHTTTLGKDGSNSTSTKHLRNIVANKMKILVPIEGKK